ncbi:pickpocket 13 [Culex quinquefasciatus]|uniref:Pickpocket 13 n=1 Tax=Culex quinquefasciatus TaxID=7176 RepID=B0XIF0_CULQU|nr:pickpocket 13 [Culex quinquefasciatus]|eukprot:XP_001869422.1 pickpocket 13 [Culex quinquefasciatus]
MRNMERIQAVADDLWGPDHDFAMEEVLNEISYFRGESYHTLNECGGEDTTENCFFSNFSSYARLVRSSCEDTLEECYWNDKPFDCCKYFQPMETELGLCYAVNSLQTSAKNPLKIDMISNKYTGPGKLRISVLTEALIYTLGEEDVPNLITPKSEVLLIDYYISYKRQISIKDIENDPETKQVSVEQRKCRFPDENILDVHAYYSYSACSVQYPAQRCDMAGLVCLNTNYEELTIVIPSWSTGKRGVVCDCLPSCTEVDIAIVHDWRESIFNPEKRYSTIEIELSALPTERYKRNVVRGRLDLVGDAFWIVCVIVSWIGSALLIEASLEAFRTSAISFVVETSYRDWNTKFPAVVVCEMRNMERIQAVADDLWGPDHDFAMEEVLNEISYFRGESYHTLNECGGEDTTENCFFSNFSSYARLVRSSCEDTLEECYWNDKPFDCCKYFQPMETELGLCYAVNSLQTSAKNPLKIDMISNKYTGPGKLRISVLTEALIYTLGEEDVPNLITPKSEVLLIDYYISYKRQISIKDIENDPETKQVSVEQRKCRFPDENILDVHAYYSYSACSVQCRKDKQLKTCNCTNHLMPNSDPAQRCDMAGLVCLNTNYEELTIVIPSWSTGKRGVVCDCLPSCTEVDIAIVHDWRESIFNPEKRYSTIEIELSALPTERYKRNVVRGRLDLVVSVGGTTGLFVGASLLSFVEIIYYFTIRPYGTVFMRKIRTRLHQHQHQ